MKPVMDRERERIKYVLKGFCLLYIYYVYEFLFKRGLILDTHTPGDAFFKISLTEQHFFIKLCKSGRFFF